MSRHEWATQWRAVTVYDPTQRDRRGYWTPVEPIRYPPVFQWPPRPGPALGFLAGVPGYFAPWPLFYLALAAALWTWTTPEDATLAVLSPGWIGWLVARNAVIVALFFGAWHWWLYRRRAQGERWKFNAAFPDDRPNPAFIGGTQTRENVLLTFASAVPIWTAWEVLYLHGWAKGWWPMLSFDRNPVWFVLLLLAIPAWRDLHFYLVHRLIHWPPLYRAIHRLHHKNINPGPWSGLSMHPGEHAIYFSCVALHFVVPSHPAHALFNLVHAALSPAQGHCGFDRVEGTHEDGAGLETHSYAHYLHHRYFDCNYADGVLPLDRWFGSFHDGSDEAQTRIVARRKKAG